jgi:hypothetical protein
MDLGDAIKQLSDDKLKKELYAKFITKNNQKDKIKTAPVKLDEEEDELDIKQYKMHGNMIKQIVDSKTDLDRFTNAWK